MSIFSDTTEAGEQLERLYDVLPNHPIAIAILDESAALFRQQRYEAAARRLESLDDTGIRLEYPGRVEAVKCISALLRLESLTGGLQSENGATGMRAMSDEEMRTRILEEASLSNSPTGVRIARIMIAVAGVAFLGFGYWVFMEIPLREVPALPWYLVALVTMIAGIGCVWTSLFGRNKAVEYVLGKIFQ